MISIRQMAIEDYELFYDLWIHTPGMGLNTADDSKEGIARYLKRNPTTCFVAESGNKVVGALLAGHDGRRGYLYHAAVLPEFQRQGASRARDGRRWSGKASIKPPWSFSSATRQATHFGKRSIFPAAMIWCTATKASTR